MHLILGSGSPRRLELLSQLGLRPDEVRPPKVDETPMAGETPLIYCRRVAHGKAEAIPARGGEVILCADTVVALGRRILGKPLNERDAARMLALLSGRRHRVITTVVVKTCERVLERTVVTAVKVKRLSREEIDGYIADGDWRGKAGAYAIQGAAGAFVPWIQGSFSAVMGLPVYETAQLLRAAGYRA
ncbi:MAG: Maf family protein [Rhodobacter sp.]|nr:Maf family protein [Rhodobacter sp.]